METGQLIVMLLDDLCAPGSLSGSTLIDAGENNFLPLLLFFPLVQLSLDLLYDLLDNMLGRCSLTQVNDGLLLNSTVLL